MPAEIMSTRPMPVRARSELSPRKAKSMVHSRPSTVRPISAVSDTFDTEFEDETDTDESSMKSSLDLEDTRRDSATTVSSYDEVPTPRSSRSSRSHRPLDIQIKSIQGPRGPHLFRASQLSPDIDYALQMSPLFPKEPPKRTGTSFSEQTVTPSARRRATDFSIGTALASPDSESDDDDDIRSQIRSWTPRQVIDWMLSCGLDENIIECFDDNDIDGNVLLDLEFDHLREQLGIASFGKRHQLWSAICNLLGEQNAFSPSVTPFQDTSRPCSTAPRRARSQSARRTPVEGEQKRRGRKPSKGNDIVTPAESVSIVAIEQLLPKPHKCNKGERCAKWRKQQRELKQLQDDNAIGRFPVSPTNGGRIYITGDPGNAPTAINIVPNVRKQADRDTMPSIVASSDILGPGQLPEFALHEGMLGQLGNRDPQDNVRQFLSFQYVHPTETPPSPPADLAQPGSIPRSTSVPVMFPTEHHDAYPTLISPRNSQTLASNENLKRLPKLEIPERSSSAAPNANARATPDTATCRTATESPVFGLSSTRSAAASPATAIVYRLGTPASEMDVPVTIPQTGPIARDASQSVPPNMQYRQQSPVQRTSSSRGFVDMRRPSMPLPALKEGEELPSLPTASPATSMERRASEQSGSPTKTKKPVPQPTQSEGTVKHFGYGEDCTHAGYMKKRKNKLLRHEWQEAHFRLKGSQLSMHESARLSSAAKEKINVEDYGVACSSNVSSSKLSAAMKAFVNSKNADATKADSTAFNFQLVPNKDGDKKAAATGKTHHFAVTSKDERIDWMRELMLAKALQQKGKGYDVEVNGEKF